MGGGALAHVGEELLFEGEDLVLGVQHLALVILQLGGGEALGVGQGLLAFVVGGREVQVGARDFDVVAEYVVEAHLERLDAGALALAGFDLGDVLAAVPAEVAQLVELGVEAGADGAAIGEVERRLIGDGFEDEAWRRRAARRGGRGWSAGAGGLLGSAKQRLRAGIFSSERPRARRSRGPAEPSVTLASRRSRSRMPASCFAQFGAQDGLLQQFAYGVEALLDFGAVHGGAQEALAQEAAAHAGEGLIENGQDGGLARRRLRQRQARRAARSVPGCGR